MWGSQLGCIKRLQRRAKGGGARSYRFMRTFASFLDSLGFGLALDLDAKERRLSVEENINMFVPTLGLYNEWTRKECTSARWERVRRRGWQWTYW